MTYKFVEESETFITYDEIPENFYIVLNGQLEVENINQSYLEAEWNLDPNLSSKKKAKALKHIPKYSSC